MGTAGTIPPLQKLFLTEVSDGAAVPDVSFSRDTSSFHRHRVCGHFYVAARAVAPRR